MAETPCCHGDGACFIFEVVSARLWSKTLPATPQMKIMTGFSHSFGIRASPAFWSHICIFCHFVNINELKEQNSADLLQNAKQTKLQSEHTLQSLFHSQTLKLTSRNIYSSILSLSSLQYAVNVLHSIRLSGTPSQPLYLNLSHPFHVSQSSLFLFSYIFFLFWFY